MSSSLALQTSHEETTTNSRHLFIASLSDSAHPRFGLMYEIREGQRETETAREKQVTGTCWINPEEEEDDGKARHDKRQPAQGGCGVQQRLLSCLRLDRKIGQDKGGRGELAV